MGVLLHSPTPTIGSVTQVPSAPAAPTCQELCLSLQDSTRTDLLWVHRGGLWQLVGSIWSVSIQPHVHLTSNPRGGSVPCSFPGSAAPQQSIP